MQSAAGGRYTLCVGGKKASEGRVDRTVPFQFSFEEMLDVSCDLALPVTEEYPVGDNTFTGTVGSVTIDIGPNPVAYY